MNIYERMIKTIINQNVLLMMVLIFMSAGKWNDDMNRAKNNNSKHSDPERKIVLSADGTKIGFTKIGSGSVPVVMVHGALSSSEQWMPVAKALSNHCTCYVMDRWGRGESEDRISYSIEKEAEDIEAVLEAAGTDAFLLGHSSGAIYTLETALNRSVAGLILYEPPIHGFHRRFVQEVWDKIVAAAEEDRYEDVVHIFLSDEAEVPEDALAHLKTTPLWEQRVALAPHSVREWEELIRVEPTVNRYRNVEVPTLLLAGTITENHPSFATEALSDLLSNAQIAVLEGQGHTANLMAPELVAEKITLFIHKVNR